MFGDLQHYWSSGFLAANAFIGLNLVGALLLGMLVGYERSYNGRAAGMSLYGLVCMASTALTVFVGHASFWYGGTANPLPADPTRVVQGVVTGIGFLGAGVIMKDGLSISGLTTAASIWAASAIGVLLGVGFYAAALLDGDAVHAVDVGVSPARSEVAGPLDAGGVPDFPACRTADFRRSGPRSPRHGGIGCCTTASGSRSPTACRYGGSGWWLRTEPAPRRRPCSRRKWPLPTEWPASASFLCATDGGMARPYRGSVCWLVRCCYDRPPSGGNFGGIPIR